MFGRDSKGTRIDTVLAKSVRIQGDLEFGGGLHLDGQVAGNVRAVGNVSSSLSVSETGCIEGSVEVPVVMLNGTVKGDISALERLILGPRAKVQGNVRYGSIEMNLGATIQGKLVQQTPPLPSSDKKPA